MEAKETIRDGGGRKYANRQFSDQNRQDAISRVSAVQNSVSTRVANGVGIGVTKASRRSRCPLMPPLKVHHYRGKPRGRDCTWNSITNRKGTSRRQHVRNVDSRSSAF